MKPIVSSQELLALLELPTSSLPVIQQISTAVESRVRNYIGCGVNVAEYTDILPTQTKADLFFSPRPPKIGRYQPYEGQGRSLQLPQWPVRQVYAVYEDYNANGGSTEGSFSDDTKLTQGTDFWLAADVADLSYYGRVNRINNVWSSCPGSIKVCYRAGWTDEELQGIAIHAWLDASPIRQVIIDAVSDRYIDFLRRKTSFKNGGANGLTRLRLDDYEVEYETGQEATPNDTFFVKQAVATGLPPGSLALLKPFKRPVV